MENWRSVVGYEGRYEVSDLGRVRSLPHLVRHGGRCASDAMILREGRILSPGLHPAGYPIVSLKGKTHRVHRLVLEAFVGPPADGQECCHNNGTPSDCRLENLRWDTRKANHADKKRHGTSNEGERSAMARLTAGCIERIRDLTACGVPRREIAQRFDIHVEHVTAIRSGHRWRHLTGSSP